MGWLADETGLEKRAANYVPLTPLSHLTRAAKVFPDHAGVERCDLFARIENVADDLAPFEAHLGFDLGEVERVNASQRRRDYRSYYSDEKAALVGRLCATDIARFDYRF